MARMRPCLAHGILERDNNTAERAMRAVALGRTNSCDRLSMIQARKDVRRLSTFSLMIAIGTVQDAKLSRRSLKLLFGDRDPMMTLRRKAASIYLRASDGTGPNSCSRIPSDLCPAP